MAEPLTAKQLRATLRDLNRGILSPFVITRCKRALTELLGSQKKRSRRKKAETAPDA